MRQHGDQGGRLVLRRCAPPCPCHYFSLCSPAHSSSASPVKCRTLRQSSSLQSVFDSAALTKAANTLPSSRTPFRFPLPFIPHLQPLSSFPPCLPLPAHIRTLRQGSSLHSICLSNFDNSCKYTPPSLPLPFARPFGSPSLLTPSFFNPFSPSPACLASYLKPRTLRQSSSLHSLCLSGCSLHSEGVDAISAALADSRSLASLDLGHNRVSASGLRALTRALRLNTSLHTLRLEGWRDTFDDEQCVGLLAQALAGNQGLTALSLAGSEMRAGGAMVRLAQALQANRCLRALDLSRPLAGPTSSSSGGAAGGTPGAGAGAGPGAGAVVGTGGSYWSASAELAVLLQVLGGPDCCPLEELNLQGQPLGDAACLLPLACLLASPSCRLATLNLSHCGLGDAQVAALSQGLAAPRSLAGGQGGAYAHATPTPNAASAAGGGRESEGEGLNSAAAGAGDGAAASGCCPLRSLVLGGVQGLGLRGMRALSDALCSPPCALQHLDLTLCQLSGASASTPAAAGAGAAGPTPPPPGASEEESAALSAAATWGALFPALSSPQCPLRHLGLAWCSLPPAALSSLSSALSGNTRLLSLDLSGCQETEVRAAFAGLLARGREGAAVAGGLSTVNSVAGAGSRGGSGAGGSGRDEQGMTESSPLLAAHNRAGSSARLESLASVGGAQGRGGSAADFTRPLVVASQSGGGGGGGQGGLAVAVSASPRLAPQRHGSHSGATPRAPDAVSGLVSLKCSTDTFEVTDLMANRQPV